MKRQHHVNSLQKTFLTNLVLTAKSEAGGENSQPRAPHSLYFGSSL